MKHLTITLLVALALTVLVAPAQAAPETLAWQPCSSVAPEWADMTGADTVDLEGCLLPS